MLTIYQRSLEKITGLDQTIYKQFAKIRQQTAKKKKKKKKRSDPIYPFTKKFLMVRKTSHHAQSTSQWGLFIYLFIQL